MNLDRLKLFLHIVDQGSISAATKVVHLTQSAVSRSLQQLEEEVGANLFQRTNKSLVLTSAGRALVPEARRLLGDVAKIQERVTAASERNYYDLQWGSIECAAQHLLPDVLPPLLEEFPDLVLRMQTGRTPALIEAIRRNELDMALVAHCGPVTDTICYPIGPYTLRYYGLRGRFDDLAGVDTFEGLKRFPLADIVPNPGEIAPRTEDSNHQFVVNDSSTVKTMIMSGLAVGDLVDYVLTAQERKQLVTASIEPNSSCQLHLIVASRWSGDDADAIVATYTTLVTRAHETRSIPLPSQ